MPKISKWQGPSTTETVLAAPNAESEDLGEEVMAGDFVAHEDGRFVTAKVTGELKEVQGPTGDEQRTAQSLLIDRQAVRLDSPRVPLPADGSAESKKVFEKLANVPPNPHERRTPEAHETGEAVAGEQDSRKDEQDEDGHARDDMPEEGVASERSTKEAGRAAVSGSKLDEASLAPGKQSSEDAASPEAASGLASRTSAPSKPERSGSKNDWVAYAAYKSGKPEADLQSLTKAELVEKYS